MSGSELAPPSPFLLSQLSALAETARLGPAVDVACGRGRHSLALASHGLRCIALDRSRAALGELAARARGGRLPIHPVAADFERPGSALPLAPDRNGGRAGLPLPLASPRAGPRCASRAGRPADLRDLHARPREVAPWPP